jgi:hypothetical protein
MMFPSAVSPQLFIKGKAEDAREDFLYPSVYVQLLYWGCSRRMVTEEFVYMLITVF